MKPKTKLAIRRFAIRWMRKLLDVLDERLHDAEVRLREECAAARALVTPTRDRGDTVEVFGVGRVPPQRRIETFQQWEARRSGIAPVAKKPACAGRSRRRGLSAAEFDLRFAR